MPSATACWKRCWPRASSTWRSCRRRWRTSIATTCPDRDDDGLGDVAYEPNDNVDRLIWLYPQVRLLLNSPSIELLRWVQRAFPVVRSPGVRDSHPLMRMPAAEPRP